MVCGYLFAEIDGLQTGISLLDTLEEELLGIGAGMDYPYPYPTELELPDAESVFSEYPYNLKSSPSEETELSRVLLSYPHAALPASQFVASSSPLVSHKRLDSANYPDQLSLNNSRKSQ
jgi:hypothetical protein